MEANRFQDLSRFGGTARGRAAWRAQLWWLFETLFVLPTPQYMFGWRRLALIWFGDDVTLYSVAEISVGSHSVISQEAYLCAGTHDYRDVSFRFVRAPISIAGECWIGARAFIGPGVEVGHAAVIGAGSIVMKSVDAETIVAGNPAKFVDRRTAEIPAGVPN